MNIIAIESASIVCGISLFIDDRMVDIEETIEPRIHSEKLPVFIDHILKRNNINIDDLDGIAISEGPGSYTGLRIGMSLAKGMAIVANIPIIPISTLEVISRGVCIDGVYSVVLYSHKEIVYDQKFDSKIPISKIKCRQFNIEQYRNIVGFNLDAVCNKEEYKYSHPSSKNVGKLAIENFHTYSDKSIDEIVPNYVTDII